MGGFYSGGASSPSGRFAAITPSNSTILEITRGLYIGVTGDIVVMSAREGSAAGTATTFKAVPAGAILPISVCQVRATGTTATDIVALY